MIEIKENIKSDILSKEDIKLIITKFYGKLLKDDTMYPFFEDIIQQNELEHHIEIITNFWNDILFDTITYKNNVLQKHLDKNRLMAFQKEHFSTWVSYFVDTIDTFFKGENADKIKTRAQSIATVIQLKMNLYN